jgi:hypothetical protein
MNRVRQALETGGSRRCWRPAAGSPSGRRWPPCGTGAPPPPGRPEPWPPLARSAEATRPCWARHVVGQVAARRCHREARSSAVRRHRRPAAHCTAHSPAHRSASNCQVRSPILPSRPAQPVQLAEDHGVAGARLIQDLVEGGAGARGAAGGLGDLDPRVPAVQGVGGDAGDRRLSVNWRELRGGHARAPPRPQICQRTVSGVRVVQGGQAVRLNCMIQLVTKRCPPSNENACSQRADDGVMSAHSNRTTTARPPRTSSQPKRPRPSTNRPTTGVSSRPSRRSTPTRSATARSTAGTAAAPARPPGPGREPPASGRCRRCRARPGRGGTRRSTRTRSTRRPPATAGRRACGWRSARCRREEVEIVAAVQLVFPGRRGRWPGHRPAFLRCLAMVDIARHAGDRPVSRERAVGASRSSRGAACRPASRSASRPRCRPPERPGRASRGQRSLQTRRAPALLPVRAGGGSCSCRAR